MRFRYWLTVSFSFSRSNASICRASFDVLTGFGVTHGAPPEVIDLLGDDDRMGEFLGRVLFEFLGDLMYSAPFKTCE